MSDSFPALEPLVFRDFVDDVANLDFLLRQGDFCGGGGIVRLDVISDFILFLFGPIKH